MTATAPHLRAADAALLRVEDLVVEFRAAGRRRVHAVSGVSFDVLPGETLGIVGESGCGKSTTARAVMRVTRPASGSVRFRGAELTRLSERGLRRIRTSMQMIFQDPVSSLNPRRRVRDIVAEPLVVWGRGDAAAREAKVREALAAVGLDYDVVGDRYPHQFSGGQCQRISIARALVLEPELLVCDEPVSALDVSVQAQILNLLEDLKERYGLTLVFISHDLAVVKNVCDRVAVMYLGKVVEVAPADALYRASAHPYTRALLSSIPDPDPDPGPDAAARDAEYGPRGESPSPLDPPSGCRYRTRCPLAQDKCAREVPEPRQLDDGHTVACHFPITTS
ncbi:ABC transporter ATP-binding protein [Actinomadura atramentaria]|uniref:ABC transporter ATP-binding protein n=1 Tax=Actinomadura atramentaria TaxID=1990 RepID=UPI0003794A70|nr:ABC transporter ATP-binding protein [Actinomadura atramentaria]